MTPDDLVVGDVRDADVVARGIEGCQAVVHAAAVFSLAGKDVATIRATNVAATRNVIGAAVAAGLDPVVHISTFAALLRKDGTSPDLPLGDLHGPYSLSKTQSEAIARDHQAAGAPVVSIYPGGVLGPHDPYVGDGTNRLLWVAKGLFPIWPRGGFHIVDVRDVADTVVACMEPGRGPRRYVVPGAHVSGDEYFAAVSEAVGRRRPHLILSAALAGVLTRATQPLNALLPARWHYPADREGVTLTARDLRFDDSPARTELGIEPRAFRDTVRETVSWLVDAGHLPARLRPVDEGR